MLDKAARSQGIEMAVIALREEAAPELAGLAPRLHWVSLGELSRTIDLLHQEGVTHAVMAGQVKHNKIFSSIRPDWKLAKLLFSAPAKMYRFTHRRSGRACSKARRHSAWWIRPHFCVRWVVPQPGVLTRRAPDARESADIAYGLEIARQIAGLDLGQTVIIRDLACVAIEAMEGTDEAIERCAVALAAGGPLVVVKVAKPPAGHAFRCTRCGLPHRRSHEGRRRHRAGYRCRQDPSVRPHKGDRAGRCGRHRHSGVCLGRGSCAARACQGLITPRRGRMECGRNVCDRTLESRMVLLFSVTVQ